MTFCLLRYIEPEAGTKSNLPIQEEGDRSLLTGVRALSVAYSLAFFIY